MSNENKRSESKYAKKRRSGKMMYGPVPSVPKHPTFVMHYPPAHMYWWGQPRKQRVSQA